MKNVRKALENIKTTLYYDEGIGYYGYENEEDIQILEAYLDKIPQALKPLYNEDTNVLKCDHCKARIRKRVFADSKSSAYCDKCSGEIDWSDWFEDTN